MSPDSARTQRWSDVLDGLARREPASVWSCCMITLRRGRSSALGTMCLMALSSLQGCRDAPEATELTPVVPAAAEVSAARKGKWAPAFTTPVVAVHTSLLPTGKVLTAVASGFPLQRGRHRAAFFRFCAHQSVSTHTFDAVVLRNSINDSKPPSSRWRE